MADVETLSPDDLRKHATMTMFLKLQKLVITSGLNEVVFHLEKSPLYQAYLGTGLDRLKNGGPGANPPLSDSEFERFVDLLIVMRSKA